MTKIEKIEELENRMKEFQENMQKEIGKLKKDEQEEWKPEKDGTYCFYDKDTEKINFSSYNNDEYDNIRLKNGVIFRTEQEAQRYADYQKVKREYSYEFTKEEWENGDVEKWNIYYDYINKMLQTDYDYRRRDMSKTHFKTEEQAQEFIDKYKAEILEFEFSIKE